MQARGEPRPCAGGSAAGRAAADRAGADRDLSALPEHAPRLERAAEHRVTDCRLTVRSEEHTSELQSRLHLVCRLLLEKKKNKENIEQINGSSCATADVAESPVDEGVVHPEAEVGPASIAG